MGFDDHQYGKHFRLVPLGRGEERSTIRNLLGRDFVLCDENGQHLRTMPPDGTVDVKRAPTTSREILGFPCDVHSPATSVRLDGADDDPVIVALVVAEAMRALGLRRRGPVFTPKQLVSRDGVALGSPGLIFHPDLLERGP